MRAIVIATVLALGVRFAATTSTLPQGNATIQPDATKFSKILNGHAEVVAYRGQRAIKLVPAPETKGKDRDMLAILDAPVFKDGTIDVAVAGQPRPGMPP